ncbi:pyridoxine 5'-phosphate synthase [Coxiella endosymbiont of Ornithodoros amblus]|uniref:pyridoxine 5'-phosphate synthase n=1 Tax=Coxiella endosymbiont of Ornithodoros amblus TaxID=1656166 RepID=UPI00244DE28B|nr:pyridoxine 5'-phosphate synthase [Coxiella endosymbiont of Ornithodoros amblus]MBW5803053.1 pyridoxine 5'-phosphate synthase [Coxiella endosymbiont of Ornithodoros amblus]
MIILNLKKDLAMVRLGVNIDHIATLRQARGVDYPDPVEAAMIAIEAGADGITLHLREDRRHIQGNDVRNLKRKLTVPMNLEMTTAEDIIQFAEEIKPERCCLVPEKREELTTEGGLDVAGQKNTLKKVCARLAKVGIEVSLFIDPEEKQINAAKAAGAPVIEIHTGHYANAKTDHEHNQQLKHITAAAAYADSLSLIVNAGHGLTIHNIQPIAAIPVINELNIGHSIISRGVLVGLAEAVKEMKTLIAGAQ